MTDYLLGGNFVTRDCCGPWTDGLVTVNQLANATIAVAYLLIPVALSVLWVRRRDVLPRSGMLLCFAAFIFACALTHVCDVVAFWYAPYRLFTVIDVLTAAVSASVALALPGFVRHVSTLPTPDELRELNMQLVGEFRAKEEALAETAAMHREAEKKAAALEAQVHDLQRTVQHLRYARATDAQIQSIHGMLDRILETAGGSGHHGHHGHHNSPGGHGNPGDRGPFGQ